MLLQIVYVIGGICLAIAVWFLQKGLARYHLLQGQMDDTGKFHQPEMAIFATSYVLAVNLIAAEFVYALVVYLSFENRGIDVSGLSGELQLFQWLLIATLVIKFRVGNRFFQNSPFINAHAYRITPITPGINTILGKHKAQHLTMMILGMALSEVFAIYGLVRIFMITG